MTLKQNDTQQHNTLECHYADDRYAECLYAELSPIQYWLISLQNTELVAWCHT